LSQTPLVIGNATILFLGDHIKAVNHTTGSTIWYAIVGDPVSMYGYYRTSPPFIFNNNIYFTSKKYSGIGRNVKNEFISLDLPTGNINWKQTLPLFSDIDMPVQVPICTNEFAMVAVYNVLYAFDRHTGTAAWNFTRGSQFLRNPCLGNNLIYIAGNSNFLTPDSLFAINAGSGTLIWSQGFESDVAFGFNSAPAYSNGRVFINMSNGICCLNANTGIREWRNQVNESLSPMFIEDDKLYTCSDENKIIYSVNTADGTVNWQTRVANDNITVNMNEGPAVINNLVLARHNAYYAVDKTTGSPVWSAVVYNGLFVNPPFTPNLTANNGFPVFYGATGMR
jgi:outer membrane protein assembly factor BamB